MKNKEEAQKALDKVRKLMAMARGGTPNEQAIALDKASKLMREHQIDAHDLLQAEIETYQVPFGKGGFNTVRDYHSWMLHQLCRVFTCKHYLSAGYNGLQVVVVGFSPGAEVCAFVMEYLLGQLKWAHNTFLKDAKAARGKRRIKAKTSRDRAREFCLGWVTGVLEHASLQVTEAPKPVPGINSALTVTPFDILTDYIAKQGPMGSHTAKSTKAGNYTEAGYAAGQGVRVRAGVNGARPTGAKLLG